MGTIYLRQKKSGNFEFSDKNEATHKFKTQKSFIDWYNTSSDMRWGNKIIKAHYSQSQTYFYSAKECIDFIKKNNIF